MSFDPIELRIGVLEIFAEARRRGAKRQNRFASAELQGSKPHGFMIYDPNAAELRFDAWQARNPGAAAKRTREHKLGRVLVYAGVAKTVLQWANERKMSPWTLSKRLERGWGPWRALHEPVREATGAAAMQEAAE